jgi:hypothetical protein
MGTVARFNDLRSGRCRRAASSPDPPPSPPSNRHGGGGSVDPLYGTFAAYPEHAGIARHVDGVIR